MPTRTSPLPLLTPGRISIPRPASLVEAIQSALQDIPLQHRPIQTGVNGMAIQPRMFLAVLAYYYATEVYSSYDIRNYVMADTACRAALGGEFAVPSEIRAFRHANRPVLEKCLTAALRFLEEQTAGLEVIRTSQAETMIMEEARRRILFAACLDSMELDHDCFSC